MKRLRDARVAVVGGGPAGLMAAEVLSAQGIVVDLYEARASVGRKFLLAGKGGLNITHSEAADNFVSRYRERSTEVGRWLDHFDAQALRRWCSGLGIDTFVGSSGRVFPTGMKAAPLLRTWLTRLRTSGVRFHVRHHWTGWDAGGNACFVTPDGQVSTNADALLLAAGGASWPQLGSDGLWVSTLAARGVDISPLRAANCGFDLAWSPHFSDRHAGDPVKNISIAFVDADGHRIERRGECLISAHGLEGSLIYALSAPLRDSIERAGYCDLTLDLLPAFDAARVRDEVAHPRGSRSLSSHLASRLGLSGVKLGLLHEVLDKSAMTHPERIASAIKSLPLRLLRTRPLAEAISTAGGVRLEALNDRLMLKALPGVFCAGEMLDWEAPTGGYLLTATMASGRLAADGIVRWLQDE